MTIPLKCATKRKDKTIVIEENHKSIRIDNKSGAEIEVIRVDGCAIVNKTACDFAAFEGERGALIELKGRDTEQALKQLEETHKFFSSERPNCKTYCGYVISAKVPSTTPGSLRKLEGLYNRTKMKVTMRTRLLTCSAEALFG